MEHALLLPLFFCFKTVKTSRNLLKLVKAFPEAKRAGDRAQQAVRILASFWNVSLHGSILCSSRKVPLLTSGRVQLLFPQDLMCLSARIARCFESRRHLKPSFSGDGRRVQKIGNRLEATLNHHHRQVAKQIADIGNDELSVRFQYHVKQSSQLNACAMPDGYILVNDGLIRRLPWHRDGALAFVIAHEMAHVIAAHSSEAIALSLLQVEAAELAFDVITTRVIRFHALYRTIHWRQNPLATGCKLLVNLFLWNKKRAINTLVHCSLRMLLELPISRRAELEVGRCKLDPSLKAPGFKL